MPVETAVTARRKSDCSQPHHTRGIATVRNRLLLIYLGRINELADRPEFYDLLTNSCTINIVRYANAAGRSGGTY
jgi:Domain of unknown function (DUF4105)